MNTVHIRYFNLLATYAGVRQESLQLAEGTTISGLVAILAGRHPGAFCDMVLPRGQPSPHLRIFCNETPVNPENMESALVDGDTLLLFPAVAGGSLPAGEDAPAGTLILPEWLILSAREPPRRSWGVRVVGDLITDVASNEDLAQKYPVDRVIQAREQVLSPGFVNTHTHLYGVLAHGIPLTRDANAIPLTRDANAIPLAKAPEGFWPFLKDFWWPMVEDRIDPAMLRAAVDWQCRQMAASGVTTFYDCLEAPNALPGCLEVEAEVVQRHGLRAVLSFEATQRCSHENGELGLAENYAFTSQHGKAGGLIHGLMCFHTTFTCQEGFIRRAFDLAQELGCLVHMHLSEGTYEPEQAVKKYGLRPAVYYDRLGVLGPGMLASQCVQLDADEVALIASLGARVSHMPLSNCEVGGGIAPIPQLLAAGATVGLGSDSYIDNFFEVMRGAFLIHKAAQRDPRLMPASLVYYLATEGGARALDLEGVGRISPGWKADLLLIDARFPTPAGEWNLYDQLILYRNPEHVQMVMVDGRIIRGYDAAQAASAEKAARRALLQQAGRLWKNTH